MHDDDTPNSVTCSQLASALSSDCSDELAYCLPQPASSKQLAPRSYPWISNSEFAIVPLLGSTSLKTADFVGQRMLLLTLSATTIKPLISFL